MLIRSRRVQLPLDPGQMAHVDLPPRTRLRGVAGQAWVTLDHDPRDIVLGPGDEFTTDGAAHGIVSALRADGPVELLVGR